MTGGNLNGMLAGATGQQADEAEAVPARLNGGPAAAAPASDTAD